ncbi:amidohydrolase [Paractinoplanes rishiriensis]|uniref:Amidohydrolase n=1 Tax=Paractinoplanes rishiriensis TaxID=1050105 RepID=A0A919K4P3_9ACTN|nr:amidohydrolase [Actinoplanes rishiriensis]GIE98523.1 amidohydrolase [Actinoplanes rishiriensis]
MINNRISRRGVLTAAAAGLATTGIPGAAHARGTADTVVLNGKVLTMDRRFRRAQALAVRNGRIVAVGTNREISRLAGRGTTVVDAAGGTVLPGINDSHVHFAAYGTAVPPLSWPVDGATIAEVQQLIARAVAHFDDAGQPDAWVRGGGWNDNRIGAAPNRHDIDAVSGNHPVLLGDFSGHAVAVNSAVLRLAGVTRDTVPPPGGVIEKDAAGEPTGVFRESAAALVAGVVPPWSRADLSAGMDAAVAGMHALGITSVTDPGIDLAQLSLYEEKFRAGELPLRFTIMMRGGRTLAELDQVLAELRAPRIVDPAWLRVSQIKLIADGIPTAAQTAWLHEPYVDGSNGVPLTEIPVLHRLIKKAAAHGFQVGTHATGDAAIDAVVAGYLAAKGRAGLRHYVIHADLTPVRTLRTMARNDIGANMNATIKYLLGRTLDPYLGPARVDYQWPYRTALDLGVRVSSASDAPVTPPAWLQGVSGAVLREGQFDGGAVAGKAERITLREALESYTSTPAWQDRAETWKGTLTEGRVADVCIVDGDLLTTDPHDLPGLRVSTTLVNGKVVYDSGASSSRAARTTAAGVQAFSRDQAVSCLQRGECCCRLSEKLLAGS